MTTKQFLTVIQEARRVKACRKEHGFAIFLKRTQPLTAAAILEISYLKNEKTLGTKLPPDLKICATPTATPKMTGSGGLG